MRTDDVTRRQDGLAPLTEAQAEEPRGLAERPDEGIDASDLPPLSDARLAGMVRGRFYRPVEQQVTARLDADVLAWLRAGGTGYQGRVNAILRQAMQRAKG